MSTSHPSDSPDVVGPTLAAAQSALAQIQEERERLVKEFASVRQQIAAVCVLNGTPGDGDIVSAVKHLAAERSRALATLNEERDRLEGEYEERLSAATSVLRSELASSRRMVDWLTAEIGRFASLQPPAPLIIAASPSSLPREGANG